MNIVDFVYIHKRRCIRLGRVTETILFHNRKSSKCQDSTAPTKAEDFCSGWKSDMICAHFMWKARWFISARQSDERTGSAPR